MRVGDFVYMHFNNGFIKSVLKQFIDDDCVIITRKTHILNCVPKSELLSEEEFNKIYNNEIIYE